MCDLYSWGIVKFDMPEKNLKAGDILFLTDDEAESVYGGRSIINGIGHGAIADYYHLDVHEDFRHEEGLSKVPAPVYAEISKGNMRKMAKAVNPEILKLTYHEEGGMFVVDEDNLTWQMKSPEYEVVFDACRKWLDANHPDVADRIMAAMLRHRNEHVSPHGSKGTDFLPRPYKVVDELLNWSAVGELRMCDALDMFIKVLFRDE